MGGMTSLIAALVGFVWFLSAKKNYGRDWRFVRPRPDFPVVRPSFHNFALANAVYNFRNATSENRHSLVDITDAYDEPDPWIPACAGNDTIALMCQTHTPQQIQVPDQPLRKAVAVFAHTAAVVSMISSHTAPIVGRRLP